MRAADEGGFCFRTIVPAAEFENLTAVYLPYGQEFLPKREKKLPIRLLASKAFPPRQTKMTAGANRDD